MFIVGLKQMSHPKTAVRGNMLGAVGMFLAIVAAAFDRSIGGYVFIMLGLVAGTIIGYFLAQRVQMTGMPQLVGLLNGLGGGASVLVAWADLLLHDNQTTDALIAIGITGLIGAVTLTGSLVAYAKLEEWKQFKKP